MSVNVCPDDIFSVWLCLLNISWTAQPLKIFFLPNLVWWCIIMRRCVIQKNWFTILNVKVTVRAYIIKTWLFLLYLLICWSVCNQIGFGITESLARVSCGKTGWLHSRSRSQQRLKILVNVCLDGIFWTAEHFVTKLGMVIQLHEPESHVGPPPQKKKSLLSSRSRSLQGLMH